MGRLKSKDKKAILYPAKLDHPKILIQLFSKNLFRKVAAYAQIGSKLSKQKVQSIRPLIFKMQRKLHWMHVKMNT